MELCKKSKWVLKSLLEYVRGMEAAIEHKIDDYDDGTPMECFLSGKKEIYHSIGIHLLNLTTPVESPTYERTMKVLGPFLDANIGTLMENPEPKPASLAAARRSKG